MFKNDFSVKKHRKIMTEFCVGDIGLLPFISTMRFTEKKSIDTVKVFIPDKKVIVKFGSLENPLIFPYGMRNKLVGYDIVAKTTEKILEFFDHLENVVNTLFPEEKPEGPRANRKHFYSPITSKTVFVDNFGTEISENVLLDTPGKGYIVMELDCVRFFLQSRFIVWRTVLVGFEKHPSQDDENCIICQERIVSFVFRPCGHLCACSVCSTRIQRIAEKCPMCRGGIQSVISSEHARLLDIKVYR